MINKKKGIIIHTMSEYFKNFEESVIELANKLPQWNSENYNRRTQSAVSSLFEEAGEISGLISKYRTRKDYYSTPPKELTKGDFNKIREKFLDESGDLLWVLVCSVYCLLKGTSKHIDIEQILNSESIYNLSFEDALFDVIRDINLLRQTIMFLDNVENDDDADRVFCAFLDLLCSFRTFLYFLGDEYNITLENICEHNMEKLGVRYDKEGKRTDNK